MLRPDSGWVDPIKDLEVAQVSGAPVFSSGTLKIAEGQINLALRRSINRSGNLDTGISRSTRWQSRLPRVAMRLIAEP